MTVKIHQLLILGLMLTALSACGFHLRGSTQVAERYSQLSIQQDQLSDQQWRQLKSALNNASVQLTDSTAVPRLRVGFMRLRDRKLTSSSSATVSLIQLGMQIKFSVMDAQGNVLLEAQELTQNRTLELDAENVLSQQDSIRAQLVELEKDLIRAMLNRMQK